MNRHRVRRTGLLALGGIATLQVALGLCGLAAAAAGAGWCRPTAVLDWQRAIAVAAFGGLSAYLLQGARRDERIEHLGMLFLLVAVAYAHPPIEALRISLDGWVWASVSWIAAVPVDAFLPLFFWLFFREFPRALESRRSKQLTTLAVSLSVAAGLTLTAVALAIEAVPSLGAFHPVHPGCDVARDALEPGPLAFLDRADRGSIYWAVVFGLVLPSLPVAFWRARRAPSDEQRRVALFAGSASLVAIPPVCLAILPALSSSVEAFVRSEWAGRVLIPINLLLILSTAALTSYAVVVRRMLPVRTLLRKAAQYALARAVVAVLAGVPFALLGWALYRSREESLATLFTGSRAPWMILGLLVVVAVLRLRQRVMLTVDRLFFREPYDRNRVLNEVTQLGLVADSAESLATGLTAALGDALHPEAISLLVAPSEAEEFVPVGIHRAPEAPGPIPRRLHRSSALVRLLQATGEPLHVDLPHPGAALRALPDDDRLWLADAGAEVLAPVPSRTGGLNGLLVVGPKVNELPFSLEDVRLLDLVARATSIGLEGHLHGARTGVPAAPGDDESCARECDACGHVAGPGTASCEHCSGAMQDARLPLRPFGKFLLRRRLGAGAMGIVYQAEDVTLGRLVAIKTLPRTSAADSVRLRQEARAMARITHPNLASIHGAETWQGTPSLVIEYLPGGTLADRLRRGPLGLESALELAGSMARVLEHAHEAGILHRDVKPSNIGFTASGIPKLLDFGLARIAGEPLRTSAGGGRDDASFAGTPLYMSPEALDGARPDPGFDLWALALVACEAAFGRHPFDRGSGLSSFRAIHEGWEGAVARGFADGPEPARKLFESALAADRSRRPDSAAELAQAIWTTADALRSLEKDPGDAPGHRS